VNDGPNLGDDVLYSGTVAAAIEGPSWACQTIAVSLNTSRAPGGISTPRQRSRGLLVAQLLRKASNGL